MMMHKGEPNQSIEPRGGDRSRQCVSGNLGRLPPVTHARR
jgi:hypothetical protein